MQETQLASPVVAAQVVQTPLITLSLRLMQRLHWVALLHWAQPAEHAVQPPVELWKNPCTTELRGRVS